MKLTVIWNDPDCDGPECYITTVTANLHDGITRESVLEAAILEQHGPMDFSHFESVKNLAHVVAVIVGEPVFL